MSSADYDVAYCDACERCHLNGICPLTDKAQKVVSMTDAGWAGKVVGRAATCPDGVSVVYAPTVEKLLKAEHARAVRIVKAVVKHAAHAEQKTKLNRELNAYWQGKLDGAENILAALQRGRGGKG